MNPMITDKQELEFSERYSSGIREGRDETESSVFQAYAAISEGLRTYPAPNLDVSALAERMAQEMKLHPEPVRTRRRAWTWNPAPAFAVVCAVLLVFGLVQLVPLLYVPNPAPADSILFTTGSKAAEDAVPWIWKHRLQNGRLVTVPSDTSATLRLSDGSVIFCSPETQLSIRMTGQRRIILNDGSLVIHAAHIPDKDMIVQTPLGDARVVGTVFRIHVNR